MSGSLSTFGQVLMWVRDRLDRVEEIMSQNSESKDDIYSASQAINEVLKHDKELENDFINAAESEYEILVRLIQSRNPPMTDEAYEVSEQIMGELQKDSKTTRRAKELSDRMRNHQA